MASTKNGSSSVCVVLRHRDRVLLHRLEQRALRLGRGAVDLVGEHDVGEDRAGLEREALVAALVLGDHHRADDVGRHQVGRELDAREAQIERGGQRAHEHGLAEAGHAFEQRVAAGEQAGQHAVEDRALADDQLADLFAHAAHLIGEVRHPMFRAHVGSSRLLARSDQLEVASHVEAVTARDFVAVDHGLGVAFVLAVHALVVAR